MLGFHLFPPAWGLASPKRRSPWLCQANGICHNLMGAEPGLPGGAGNRLLPLRPCPWLYPTRSILKQGLGQGNLHFYSLPCVLMGTAGRASPLHLLAPRSGVLTRCQQPALLPGAAAPALQGINQSPGKEKNRFKKQPRRVFPSPSEVQEPQQGLGQGWGPLSPTHSTSPQDHRCPHALACRQ